MIVEFFGIPGSGKTFLANKIVAETNNKKYQIVNLIDKSRTSIFYKIMFRVLFFFAKREKQYCSNVKKIQSTLSAYQTVPAKYNKVFIDRYVNKIAFYLYLYERLEKKGKIYLFDEGIYQQVVNMMVNYGVSQKDALCVIKIVSENFFRRVFFECDIETSFLSMKKRNRHVCFIDDLNEEDLKVFLSQYEVCCECLAKMPFVITMKRSSDFEINKTVFEGKVIS